MVELDDGAVRPKSGVELLPGDYLARPLEQHPEHFQCLRGKPQFTGILAEFASYQIQFVLSKTDRRPPSDFTQIVWSGSLAHSSRTRFRLTAQPARTCAGRSRVSFVEPELARLYEKLPVGGTRGSAKRAGHSPGAALSSRLPGPGCTLGGDAVRHVHPHQPPPVHVCGGRLWNRTAPGGNLALLTAGC